MAFSQWLHEPEFNRWYIKWIALDFVRAALLLLALWIYQHFSPVLGNISSISGFALACLLVLVVAAILAIKPKPHEVVPTKPESEALKTVVAIESPAGGKVPLFKIVRGFAYPSPALVQVLILAGPPNDRRWFPQLDAEIARYGWTAKCRFGDEHAPVTGWDFDFCAVIPRTRINETVKEIPTDAIVSQIVHVSLDRKLPDEDFP
jgi:hypothetical protein